MSTELLGVKVNDLGQIVLPTEPADREGRRVFFQEFLKTAVGQRFAPYNNATALARVGEIVERWFPDERELTIPQLERVVENLLAVRDPSVIPPAPEPAAVVDHRPRNAQGQFLSEYESWASDPRRSMKDIRLRAQQDRDGFGAWFHKATVAQTLQDGGLRVVGAPTRQASTEDHAALDAFVREYRITPASRLKPLNGFITLGDRRYTPREFERWIEQASAAGLL